ncbi:hypothetical protein CRG98_036499 [Punica granatum]|uniref:Uncharacterized protein n=1 Tax=Punica granatum TaxID=22663 RepID=A0A2I0IHE8_PUNGR|nr:hypothetical protein CRG98_036499 [Punica granatum]
MVDLGLGPPTPPPRSPASSVGTNYPESTENSDWRSPIDSGSRPPIGDPDPSAKVVGTYGGRLRLRQRGRVVNWWPRSRIDGGPPIRVLGRFGVGVANR